MNNNEIALKKAREVFPSKYTKVRSHDLISLSIDKKLFLTPTEQRKLQTMASNIREGFNKNFGINQDMIATRTGKKIKFEPLFDE